MKIREHLERPHQSVEMVPAVPIYCVVCADFITELTEVKLHNLEHHIEIKVNTNQTDGAYF